jgi:Ca2+-binding EF-hand superfamily protein
LEKCFQQKLWLDRGKKRESNMAEIIRKYKFITAPYRFDLIDKNSDDKIDLQEYMGFGRERFENFDHNQSGIISGSEFCSSYHSSMFCDV